MLCSRGASKRIFLSEAGNVLPCHAKAILDQVTQASQFVAQVSRGVTHHLNLGTTMLKFFLPSVFEGFRKRFPRATVHIKAGQQSGKAQCLRPFGDCCRRVLSASVCSYKLATESRACLV